MEPPSFFSRNVGEHDVKARLLINTVVKTTKTDRWFALKKKHMSNETEPNLVKPDWL
jgi:hypothetical protein